MSEDDDQRQMNGQPLAAWASALLAQTEVRAAWRRLFRADLGKLSAGWPRRLTNDGGRAWCPGPDVLVRLVRVPQDGASEAWLLIPIEACARLVDRLLGGVGQSGVACALGAPSEAECGVLAYAISHLCAASNAPFIVRDVVSVPARGVLEEAEGMVWCPLALDTQWGPVEVRVLLTSALTKTFASRHVLTLVMSDAIEPQALSALEVGDVLVSDAWALTSTTRGLVGFVELAVEGSDARLRARLEGDQITVDGPSLKARAPDGVELVLARQLVELAELAEIGAGTLALLAAVAGESAALYRAGQLLAQGRLVSVRGALGLRVSRIAHSMR